VRCDQRAAGWEVCGDVEAEGEWSAETKDQVIQMMIGRPVADYLPQYTANPNGKSVLSVKHLSSPGKFEDVSFDIRAGRLWGLRGWWGGAEPGGRGAVWIGQAGAGGVVLDGAPLALAACGGR